MRDYRNEIAKRVVQYAREQKQSVETAMSRAINSGRFDNAVKAYAKAKKIGVTEAWRRVFSAVK